MGYIVDIYKFPDSTEYEFKWAGNYGAKGEKRRAKVNPTPEQVRKQNQWKREKYSRRVLKLNFTKDDLWCTLLYPQGTRKPVEEVKADMQKFLRKLRVRYKKRGEDLKFMYRIEIGSRGGIHVHMICNDSRGDPAIDKVVQSLWKSGRVHFERFGGEEEDYEKLADYIVKEPDEEQKKKTKKEEQKALIAFSTSRNLIRPVAVRKEYKRKTVRKMIEDGIEASEGFVVVKESILQGVNPYTGMSYLYYTEVRNDPGGGG